MGLFDTVKCEYPLPLPEDLGECDGEDWEEVEFQTKSMGDGVFGGGFMDSYSISDDGQLYLEKVDLSLNEKGELERTPDGIERQDYTGEIIFYTVVPKDEKDYWMEFKATYYKGDLKEMELLEWKPEENEERKEAQKQFSDFINKEKSKRGSWWYPVYKFYITIVRKIFGFVRWILNSLMRFSLWLEQKLY
jgi:hypothetical protein